MLELLLCTSLLFTVVVVVSTYTTILCAMHCCYCWCFSVFCLFGSMLVGLEFCSVCVWVCVCVQMGSVKLRSYWINRFNMYINEIFVSVFCSMHFFRLSCFYFVTIKIAPFIRIDIWTGGNINLRWYCTTAFVRSLYLVAPAIVFMPCAQRKRVRESPLCFCFLFVIA